MSATAGFLTNYFKNMASFVRLTKSYFRRRNPFLAAIINFLNSVYELLSIQKRLRSLKYQVQLSYYRMQQMDKMMHEYNPNNSKGGFNLNKYR